MAVTRMLCSFGETHRFASGRQLAGCVTTPGHVRMQNSNQGWAGWEGASVDLQLTEEQELLLKSVREFAEREVRPLAKELDETGRFPRELFKKAAELGLTGVPFPESEGGAGFDHIAYTIVIEEISRCCASTGVILSVQNSLYCDPLHRYGTEEQKKKFLLPYARGEKIGCYALTEPQAGSNAAALQTKAIKNGDVYVLNGTKAWITNGGAADAAIVYVNTDPAKGEKGHTALVADMSTEIAAARLLIRKAAWKQDTGARFSMDAAIANLFASEMSTRVTHKAIQIHGGNGYSREYPVERNYRDARITEIYEGTSEIQRLVISSWVLKS